MCLGEGTYDSVAGANLRVGRTADRTTPERYQPEGSTLSALRRRNTLELLTIANLRIGTLVSSRCTRRTRRVTHCESARHGGQVIPLSKFEAASRWSLHGGRRSGGRRPWALPPHAERLGYLCGARLHRAQMTGTLQQGCDIDDTQRNSRFVDRCASGAGGEARKRLDRAIVVRTT